MKPLSVSLGLLMAATLPSCSILDGLGIARSDGGSLVGCNPATHQEGVDQDGASRCCLLDSAVDSLSVGQRRTCDDSPCLVLANSLDSPAEIQCCDTNGLLPYRQEDNGTGICCEATDEVSAECEFEGTCVLRDENTVDC